ncbi:hypothetical protein ElyMa_004674100 [Elysia marginata]|uniref:Uncharacterized protein n=1 Tax=Elysia marginata TaxID=1093978 RepID=A0AAV4I828_9GAST|nr:hypothetical protein ElyMa_004674100 [Elysia marginata]
MVYNLNCLTPNRPTQFLSAASCAKIHFNIAKEGIFIPPDLKEGRFTQVAFDNLDFSDVQKDGSSFHATTHVIYQYKEESQSPVKSDVSTQRGRRKSCQTSEAFYTKKSNLTIQDRRAARSVNQALPDDDLEHAAIIYEFEDEIGVWLALKLSHFGESLSSELETLPALDSFLAALETKPSKKTLIQYGPIFPESPTKPDVVKASLDYFQELSRKLGQGETVITCDQAIYDIAKALVTKEREMYPHVIPRLGGFHIAENFLKAIGSFMQNSGLENPMSESGLCGPGTANKVLSAKDYYQMLSFHSTVADGMLSAQWIAFEAEMKSSKINHVLEKLSILLPKIKDVGFFHRANAQLQNETIMECKELLQEVKSEWKLFQESLGVTAKF